MMLFDLENPLLFPEEEKLHYDSISNLFNAEPDFSTNPTEDLNFFARQDVVFLAKKMSDNLSPSITYLAINYINRFLSKREIPQDKPWIARILCISCLSLAAKMTQNDFSLANLQIPQGEIAGPEIIMKMIRWIEVLVANTLEWNLRSITPFAFLHFFITFFPLVDANLRQALKDQASKMLFKAQDEIKLLDFKPSVIAVSALLSAALELFPTNFPSFQANIYMLVMVNKMNLTRCYNVMREVAKKLAMNSNASIARQSNNVSKGEMIVQSSSEG